MWQLDMHVVSEWHGRRRRSQCMWGFSSLLAVTASVLKNGGHPSTSDVEEALAQGLRHGRWHSGKQAFQAFSDRLEVKDENMFCKGTGLIVPSVELWKEMMCSAHGERHLSACMTWQVRKNIQPAKESWGLPCKMLSEFCGCHAVISPARQARFNSVQGRPRSLVEEEDIYSWQLSSC